MIAPERPLSGTRIIAVEQYGAGPWGSMQLADLGADVIKIEDPRSGGDVGRYVPPYQDGEDSLFFEAFNRGKRSVSLDLRTPSGKDVFLRMVREADAVYSNLRGDQPARLGITYSQLAPTNPRIVCCALSGFGATGPRAGEAAYDYVIQGLTGWMQLTGEPDGPPAKTGLSLVDFCGGYVAALTLLAALLKVRAGGDGCDCDVSLFETALSLTNYIGTWAATAGFVPERLPESAHPSIVPFQNLPTQDGWIVVACAKAKFWHGLCAAIGEPELATQERFSTFASRHANREALVGHLRAVLRQRTTSAWLEELHAHGVPCAPINSLPEALEDPQVTAREMIQESTHPRFGRVRHIASPLRVGDAPRHVTRAPARGEHTREVLRDVCGYGDEAIDALASRGTFGPEEGV